MNQYMDLIGKNARKASLGKINTKTKNKVLKKEHLLYPAAIKKIYN